ncbi:MAG TPA: ISAzo13 family transposase [Ktedonobacteraceae bacterium]|jgi:transposase
MKQDDRTEKYQQMRQLLNEKQWRQFLALEAKERGNILLVAREAKVSKNTIKAGRREIEAGELFTLGKRIRGSGGGRKPQEEHDASLQDDLEALLEPKGDPMSLVRWTTKSVVKLKEAQEQQGHQLGETAIRKRLHERGFSLRANKKNIEGSSHADRDTQFGHINEQCKQFEVAGDPSISVDCKKKELIGTFQNNGREWQAKGEETTVNVYDYLSLADGKAIPSGVYDLLQNQGFVNVGIDHDTAAFAVESIRRWWNQQGKSLYPKQSKLLITADGGGSNAARSRLWKREMQQLANETGLCITVCHFPPGTSKWNKIEHRLFSYISLNWRAKPLISLETVIELISHTTTQQGLVVTAIKDSHTYPTGIKVSDEELEALHIIRDDFHGEWNYTFLPEDFFSQGQVI